MILLSNANNFSETSKHVEFTLFKILHEYNVPIPHCLPWMTINWGALHNYSGLKSVSGVHAAQSIY